LIVFWTGKMNYNIHKKKVKGKELVVRGDSIAPKGLN